MGRLEVLRSNIEYLEACLRDIHERAEGRSFTEDEQRQWTEGVQARDGYQNELTSLEERHSVLQTLSRNSSAVVSGDGAQGPNVIVKRDPFEILESRGHGLSRTEFRNQVLTSSLRAVEDLIEDQDNQAHYERTVKRHVRSSPDWALNWIARSRPEYASAWVKAITGNEVLLSTEERAALAVGTNTQGGYLVPTHLDPTLILTNSGSANIMRSYARVVNLSQAQGNTWHGVTTAGVTASFDAELAEVSDDTPGIGTVSVSTFKAQSLVQASIESFEDIAGLESDVMMLFADARDRLEGAKHMTGSGSGEPKGIFTALDASTTVELTSTTAATIGEVDIHAVYKAVPQRWRGRSSWLMAPVYNLAIKRLGTAVSSSYSGDLTQPVSDRILGRPVIESDDAPTTQTTTALDNEIAFGDFSNFLVVDKPGSMSIEFIPHLFNTSNNLPDGRRGWYAHWRTGSDATNILAFRLLQDKTSA